MKNENKKKIKNKKYKKICKNVKCKKKYIN